MSAVIVTCPETATSTCPVMAISSLGVASIGCDSSLLNETLSRQTQVGQLPEQQAPGEACE
jgi:hypothetical protein